jgi:hypothetical protein
VWKGKGTLHSLRLLLFLASFFCSLLGTSCFLGCGLTRYNFGRFCLLLLLECRIILRERDRE